MMGYGATTAVRYDSNRNGPDGGQTAPRKLWDEPGVVDTLKRLVSMGHSAAIVAHQMNETYCVEPPMSRCAVIGKCSRLGISLSSKPQGIPRDAKRPREPRLVSVRSPSSRNRSPSEALLALPSTIPPGGIAISRAHRDTLILAARAHDRWHQSLVDHESALDHAALHEEDASTIAPALPYPDSSAAYWPEQPPKTFMDVRMPGECSYITARSKSGDTYYCGLNAGEGERCCQWHKRLCYMPPSKA